MKAGPFSGTRRLGGYSILELLVAIGIVIALVGLTIPILETFRKRAKRVQCISHMRAIHSGLQAYHSDVGHWPQMDAGKEGDFSEEEFYGFWVEVTKPYGLSEDAWVCPADRAIERRRNEEKQKYYGSYVVTQFDDKPATPFRWSQPWAIERGNMHGDGAHILLPDGSVQPANNPFFGR